MKHVACHDGLDVVEGAIDVDQLDGRAQVGDGASRLVGARASGHVGAEVQGDLRFHCNARSSGERVQGVRGERGLAGEMPQHDAVDAERALHGRRVDAELPADAGRSARERRSKAGELRVHAAMHTGVVHGAARRDGHSPSPASLRLAVPSAP